MSDSTEPATPSRAAGPHPTVAERVYAERLTYLKPRALRQLARRVREVEKTKVPGVLVEAGTALGGSAIVMASAKRRRRPLLVFDAFGMIPPPTPDDGEDVQSRYAAIVSGQARGIDGDVYYGYRSTLLDEVTASFEHYDLPLAKNNVTLVPGLFEDSLRVDGPVALAHLDGDWYSSTMTCLERLVPRLSVGGRVIIDDYNAWSGCRKAVDEYFSRDRGCVLEHYARLHAVRVEGVDGQS
jgi:hypothetical protein